MGGFDLAIKAKESFPLKFEQKCEGVEVIKEGRVAQIKKTVYAKAL